MVERWGINNEHLNKAVKTAELGLVVFALLNISTFAFSTRIKKEILKRDDHECVKCGANEHLEAAHYDHDKRKGKYNKKSNGRILCTDCHVEDHIENLGQNGLPEHQNEWAIRTMLEKIRKRRVQKEAVV